MITKIPKTSHKWADILAGRNVERMSDQSCYQRVAVRTQKDRGVEQTSHCVDCIA